MNKYLFTILTITIFYQLKVVNAQAPDWSWAKSSGAEDNDFGSSTTLDSSGNVFVTGSYSSDSITFGSYTLINMGTTDMFIVKYDALGNVIWAKGSGSSDTYSYGIATDVSGNVYVIGRYGSSSITFGNTTLFNSGSWDIFIVKYDTNGNVLWAKSEGGLNSDYGYNITTDLVGNVYITGRYSSPSISFGNYTINNFGNADVFIVKYDSIGNVLWAKSLGGSGDEIGFGITADLNNDVYVTGYFVSPTIIIGSDTMSNSGGSDIFLVKFDSIGNAQWLKNAGGTGWDNGYSVATDDSGYIYLTGYFLSPSINFGAFSLINSSNLGNTSDLFIAKFDLMGNIIWANGAGSIVDDVGYDIAVDNNNNIYITGNYNSPSISFGNIILSNTGSSHDIFIAKYNSSGNVNWAIRAGSIYDDYSNSNALDLHGNIYITGRYNSSVINFGTNTIANFDSTGNYVDVFIAKLNCASTPIITTSGQTTFCQGDSISLSVSSGINYLWSSGDTTQTITVNSSGSYYAIVSTGGCTLQSTPTTIAVNPLPVAPFISSVGNLYTICADTSLTLTGNVGGIWNNGSSLNQISVSSSGDYFVTASNACGIDTSNIISIIVNPLPSPSINDSIGYLTIDSAIYSSYQWYINGVAIVGANSSTYYYTTNGEYSVQVTNLNGCIAISDSLNIITVDIGSDFQRRRNKIKWYPNPAHEILNVEYNFEVDHLTQIRIVDMLGNDVFYKRILLSDTKFLSYQISIANLSNGIYFLYVNENKFKFIKN
jgi:hypothetical protein